MNKNSVIFISGGQGLVGSAMKKLLTDQGYTRVLTPHSKELNLVDPHATMSYFEKNRPEYVFHFAGAVYGLGGNLKDPARSYFLNTAINTNVVDATYRTGVKKILAMGSICAYPQNVPSDRLIDEAMIFDGRPNPGEEAYGTSKRSMLIHLEACRKSNGQDFVFMISTNLYGPEDRFNTADGHVIPSLVKKFYDAKHSQKPIQIWGDGLSNRDFLFSKDAAMAMLMSMEKLSGAVNLATGTMNKIKDVVDTLTSLTGTHKLVSYDPSKPKGHEFFGFDTSKLKSIGFKPKYTLESGLKETFDWFEANSNVARQ